MTATQLIEELQRHPTWAPVVMKKENESDGALNTLVVDGVRWEGNELVLEPTA